MIRVLVIGQLPKEIGGNYTTGASNVAYELSKQHSEEVCYHTLGTNITARAAQEASSYKNQYIGYKFNILQVIIYAMIHPIALLRHIYHYFHVDHQNVLRYLFYEYNIRQAILNIKPDLIHVHSINNLSPVYYARGTYHVPILLTCHGIFWRNDLNDKINRDRYLGNIGYADAYTGSTSESLFEYDKYLGIGGNLVSVIPNGVDCSKFFYSLDERKKIRTSMSVPDDVTVFLTVASVQERKGQLSFLKILSKLNIAYQYWIIGDGPDMPSIEQFILDNQLERNVRLLGYCDATLLYKYYSGSDIYVHSSWKEGQALAELNAYATGMRTIVNKAIINTIAGDLRSSNYYVLDFNKVEADSIVKWINIGNPGRKSRKNFDWSIVAKQYVKLYHKIINEFE